MRTAFLENEFTTWRKGQRTFPAEVTPEAKEEVPREHPEGKWVWPETMVCVRKWQQNLEKQASFRLQRVLSTVLALRLAPPGDEFVYSRPRSVAQKHGCQFELNHN